MAEAILHYKQNGDSDDPDDNVPSKKYQEIKEKSPPIQCTENDPCKAVDCPFQKFHPLYYITCTNVQSLRLLELTPPDELPNANPKGPMDCKGCRHLINFNFEGDSQTSAVNGRNFILPSFPPQTQTEEFLKKDIKCDFKADCNPSTLECSCVHVIHNPHQELFKWCFRQLVLTTMLIPFISMAIIFTLLMLDIQNMTKQMVSLKTTTVIYTAMTSTVLMAATIRDVPDQDGKQNQCIFLSIAIRSGRTKLCSLLEGTLSSISYLIILATGSFTAT